MQWQVVFWGAKGSDARRLLKRWRVCRKKCRNSLWKIRPFSQRPFVEAEAKRIEVVWFRGCPCGSDFWDWILLRLIGTLIMIYDGAVVDLGLSGQPPHVDGGEYVNMTQHFPHDEDATLGLELSPRPSAHKSCSDAWMVSSRPKVK